MTPTAGERTDFLGLQFDPWESAEVLRSIIKLAQAPTFSFVVTPNVDHIVRLQRIGDPALNKAYEAAALCICDSRILSRLASWSGIDLPAVPGSDLTRALLAEHLPDCDVAVIGGDIGLHGELEARYPRFHWHFHVPPMGVRTDKMAREQIAAFVEASRANVVFFAIGAPQSEIVCAEIGAGGRAGGVGLCIGASLEFLTGAKQRAPRWLQRAGLEWLFRLVSEPRRLGRRYLVEGPRIFGIWRRWKKLSSDRARFGSIPSDDA